MKILKCMLAASMAMLIQPVSAKVDFDSLTEDQQNYLRAKKNYINHKIDEARVLKNGLKNYVGQRNFG